MTKIGRKLVEWDSCELTTREAGYRFKNQEEFYPEEDEKDLEEIESSLFEDSCFINDEFDYMLDHLGEILKHKFYDKDYFHARAEVSGFGWRNLDGHKYIKVDHTNPTEFLRGILPDTDCTFQIHNLGKGLYIRNYHHDSPTGESYYITPVKGSTFDKHDYLN